MESKKSIVTVARFSSDISKDGKPNFIHHIEFANGDKGNFFYKSAVQTEFVSGTEAVYFISTNDRGYTNITVPKKTGGFPNRNQDPKFENRRVALRCAVEMIIAGKGVPTELQAYYKRFIVLLDDPDAPK